MRIISANVNGIRSATAKGFFPWLARQKADVACLQEIKAQQADLPAQALHVNGLTGYFHTAEKKGYSGVGVYARIDPDTIAQGLGIKDIDAEGRYLQLDFGNLSVISVYVPSGTTSAERLAIKFSFMERFFPHLGKLRESGREIVLCGDWNIAHREIDLKNWKGNLKNSGFLPEERAWLTRIFEEIALVDVFRQIEPGADHYTWWSNRGNAWANNVGWRIDYHIATPGLSATAHSPHIYKAARFSDHAPLIIEYGYPG